MAAKARFSSQIPIGFSPAQRAWLDAQAEQRALSVAAIVRELIQAAMSAASARKRGAA